MLLMKDVFILNRYIRMNYKYFLYCKLVLSRLDLIIFDYIFYVNIDYNKFFELFYIDLK